MRKISFTPAVPAAIATVLGGLWLIIAGFALVDNQYYAWHEWLPPITKDRQYIQTLTVSSDNFCRLDVWIDWEDREHSPSGAICFELSSVGSVDTAFGERIWERCVPVAEINPYERYRLTFDPMPDSGGQTYALKLTADLAEEDKVRPRGGPDIYPDGLLLKNGDPLPYDLSMAMFYHDDAGGILSKLKPGRPWPFKSSFLLVASFLGGSAACGWLIGKIATSRKKQL